MRVNFVSLGLLLALVTFGLMLRMGIHALACVWSPAEYICYGVILVGMFFCIRSFVLWVPRDDIKASRIYSYSFYAKNDEEADKVRAFFWARKSFMHFADADEALEAIAEIAKERNYTDLVKMSERQRSMLQELTHLEKLIKGLAVEIKRDKENGMDVVEKKDQLISMMMYHADLLYRCMTEGCLSTSDLTNL